MLWVVGSLIVAFPAEALDLNLSGIMTIFITAPRHPTSVLILWALDVLIALCCLRDARLRAGIARWLGLVIVSLFVFICAALFVPMNSPHLTNEHPLWIATIALFFIWVARGLSYTVPERAIPVRTLRAGTPTNS
jgi:hypothetical protein